MGCFHLENELLRMANITKIYPNGIMANSNVNFSVRAGEIHALMGENGAGKSTLMNILFGEFQPEEGDILLNGQKITLSSPTDAIRHGIGMVHQHFMLVPSLTVSENVFLGMEPKKRGLFDYNDAVRQTAELAKKYNFNINPKARVADIPVGVKQKVEILKALARGAKILILDEPTAVLTPQETDELFNQLQIFKQQGHTVIFISHKLKEITQICDRITIMKNGRSIGVYDVAGMQETDISRLMVGREIVKIIDKTPANPKQKLLEIKDLCCINDENKQVLKNISFSVRAGEILGVAGVEGNGQLELVESITGMRPIASGQVLVKGKAVNRLSIKKIRQSGLAHIPEDRMTVGMATEASILENLIADKLDSSQISVGPVLKTRRNKKFAQELIDKFLIKCDSTAQEAAMLSGGNMQKVVVAREFSSSPAVMIANQPSRGVDVGATEFIHKKLLEIRDQGAATLLVSADLNEVLELSDSLIVLYNGEIVAHYDDTKNVTEEELGYYMLGLKKQDGQQIKERVLHEN